MSRDDLGKALNDLLDQYAEDIDTLEETTVTNVGYDGDTQQLTKTINGTTSNVVRIATLDGSGKVPSSQLPSYVDDVMEYADLAHFPPSGEMDKIYVALDTGFTYRWSGSLYVRLNTYDEATQSASGLMSASDKTKLDGIETGATKTIIYNGTDHNAPGWALDAQTGYTLSQSDTKTKHGIAYIAVLHSGNWQLNSGTNAAIGDFIFVNGNLGRATAAITGGSTNIVENTNWTKVSEGAGNRLQSIKADKVSGATNNNFAALDANGNLKDSGHKHGDYLTQHQDISGKADKATTVTAVTYDSTNKKITKTINGSTTDVVTVATIKSALGSFTWGALAGH